MGGACSSPQIRTEKSPAQKTIPARGVRFHAHQANLPCAPEHCIVVMGHPGSFAPSVVEDGVVTAGKLVVMAYLGLSAPTAHSKLAQGNALGTGNPQNLALKGRPFVGAFCAALSGLVVNGIGYTQGVALGYHRVAPSGRNQPVQG